MCLCLYSVQDGSSALFVAAQEGHLRVVEMLLEANADISIMDEVTIGIHLIIDRQCLGGIYGI